MAACGDAALIGAPAAGCGAAAGCDSGEAFLATLREGGMRMERLAPPHPEAGAAFGAAVALCEEWAAVGSPRADWGWFDAGAVDIFARGPVLHHAAHIVPPRAAASGWFGAAVALSGEWLAVGEPGLDDLAPRSGAVHLYRWRGDSWQFFESLRAPAGAVGWYGASVALAGDVLLVGAPLAGGGAASVHRRVAGAWALSHILSAGPESRAFGSSVALAPDGSEGVIGASADSSRALFGGAAWSTNLITLTRLEGPPPSESAGVGAGACIGQSWIGVAQLGDPELSPPAAGCVHLFTRRTNRPRPP